MGDQSKIGAAQRRLEEAAGCAPAQATFLVDLKIGTAFVVSRVEIDDRRNGALRRCIAERIENLPAKARRLYPPFAAGAMHGGCPAEVVLVLLEIGEYVVPAPSGQAHLPPAVVVGGLATHVDHGVDRRTAADDFATRIIEDAAVQA